MLARILGAALSLVLVAALPAGAAASQRVPADGAGPVAGAPLPAPPGRTTLLSKARNGGFPNQGSLEPSMSADGRFVAFTSAASDLVAGDKPQTIEVFVLDRRTGDIDRAPLPEGAVRANDSSFTEPSISADGRFIAFTYQPPIPNNTISAPVVRQYIGIWDRRDGDATWITLNARGTPFPGTQPSVSADGRYVAFTTVVDLPNDKDGGDADVVRWDRQSLALVLVSPGLGNEPISGFANSPSISGNGNAVAFVSDGGDSVVDEDTGSGTQVYVRNVAQGVTEQVSVTHNGAPPRDQSSDPAISGDGRYVAFASLASNITNDLGGGLFRRDRQRDRTIRVSVTPSGDVGNGTHGSPAITADGNMVTWVSTATNLVPETAGGFRPAAFVPGPSDIFIRDISSGETVLISVSRDNGPGGGRSLQPTIGGAGRYVAFASTSPNLVRGDDNKAFDVFLRDLPPVPVINPATLDFGPGTVDTDSAPLAATMGNAGWSPLTVGNARITGGDAAHFEIVADGCRARVLRRAQACTVSVVYSPNGPGGRSATLAVSDNAQGSPRTVRLRGNAAAVPDAKLEISPEIGHPGIVTIATGTGFPANAPVVLRWSQGITPTMDPVITDARGRFEIPVLVFHNDRTGRRDLVAEAARGGTPFAPATAEMLVTKPTVVPPRFDLVRLINVPFMLVFRG